MFPARILAQKRREEFAQRPVLLRRREAELDLARVSAVEQHLQRLMLDAPRKGTTAHYPRLDRQCLCAIELSCDCRDCAQRPKLVFVTYCHQHRALVRHQLVPIRLRVTLAIQVELVGLVDQLQHARLAGCREIEGHRCTDLLQKRLWRCSSGSLLAKRRALPNALQTQCIVLRDSLFPAAIAKMLQHRHECLVIVLGEQHALDARMRRSDFGEFHGAVVDEDNAISRDVPCLQNSRHAARLGIPMHLDGKHLL